MGLCLERSLGDGGRAARHPQGRRRLSAARPGLSARAAGLHARDAGAPVLVTHVGAGRAARARTAPTACALDADGRAIAAQPATRPRRRARPAPSRLRHLHLRLHRTPKGRRRHPSRHSQSASAAQIDRLRITPTSAFCNSPRRASTCRCSEISGRCCSGRGLVLPAAERIATECSEQLDLRHRT